MLPCSRSALFCHSEKCFYCRIRNVTCYPLVTGWTPMSFSLSRSRADTCALRNRKHTVRTSRSRIVCCCCTANSSKIKQTNSRKTELTSWKPNKEKSLHFTLCFYLIACYKKSDFFSLFQEQEDVTKFRLAICGDELLIATRGPTLPLLMS